MKKVICILAFVILALPVCACAVQEVFLPNSRYAVDVPDWMDYSDGVDGNTSIDAYVSKDLEMDYLSYRREEAGQAGRGMTLLETAKKQREAGSDVEIRKVNGIEMLVYRLMDEADGAPCIGYVFEDGDMLVEIIFWYATQEAADETMKIISSVKEKGQ